ncbi:adaptin N terminal region-domain-containing protein [Phanerochaete sordida]|uniref:Adaptin N terminal region-domain-containing protein n=1 Tax=Phanerochaete sordida TaxID=48140 RepID=A0A9P3L813_9APHY|nr:adaptin N terminal region-domain-containing protein [Phanerochaete sordida]
MSGLNLNAIAENATRLGTRLQETISEHTRDLAIARGASSSYFDTPEDKVRNIRKQLDSNSDREKLDAMKRLIALISKGRNVSEFFAQVVKNVASHNLEIRKLVYIYLLRYAEHEPDLALLSINTFQKDLSDPNPLIRAMALRVLSGIRVPMIGSIVVLAIKKCASDISPYVRKAAAMAIHQAYKLDSGLQPELIEIISNLLRDRSPLSIGSVATAFEAVCPTRLDLLHKHYRRLCRTLVDVDEWGQADLMALLLRYARTMLPRPVVTGDREEVDLDVRLLLTSSEPLFQSYNPAVVLAVVRVFYYAAPPSEASKIIQPMLRLLHISPEVERTVLPYLLMVSQSLAHLLIPSYTYFLIRSDDIPHVKRLKMRLLRLLITSENYQALLREFAHYAEDADDTLVKDAIGAIGYSARLVPESAQQCLSILMSFIQSKHSVVVGNAVIVLKQLVQSSLQQGQAIGTSYSSTGIISRLAYSFEQITHPQARACILWLVGQYAADESVQNGIKIGPEGVAPWAPDLLRKSALTFTQEEPIVKLQAITLGAKLIVLSPADRTLILLNRYVLSLARYDMNFDVRDRARMLGALLVGAIPSLHEDDEEQEAPGGVVLRREQVRLVLFEGKLGAPAEKDVLHFDNQTVGSLGAITGKDMAADSVLPDWLEQGVDPALRVSEDDAPPPPIAVQSLQSAVPRSIASSNLASPVVLTPTGPSPSGSYVRTDAKNAWTNLDEFYEESTEEEEEEETESEEDDSEEESEDGEEREEHHEGPESSEAEDEDKESGEEEEDDDHSPHAIHHTS